MSMIFLKLIDNKKTDSKICETCNKRFTRTGYYLHIKSINNLLKAGEQSNVNSVKRYILKSTIIIAKSSAIVVEYWLK